MSHSAPAQADELNPDAVDQSETNSVVAFKDGFVLLNPQPEPPGSKTGTSNNGS